MNWDDVLPRDLYGDRPYGREDCYMIGDGFFRIGIPPDAPLRFKQLVFAAGKTYMLGNKSVDHVLKQNVNAWPLGKKLPPAERLIRRALGVTKQQTRAAYERMHSIWKPAHTGTAVGWAAMYRLHSTIRAITYTITEGFHFESATLQRLMLEQLAWVAAIRTIDDNSFFTVRPTACISALKKLFPNIGPLYGRLTDKAHIAPQDTRGYISVEEDGRLFAAISGIDYASLDAAYLLALADIYIVICELLVADLLPQRSSIKRKAGQWVPKPNRPFFRTVRSMTDKLLQNIGKRRERD